jgi:hypothetical protein
MSLLNDVINAALRGTTSPKSGLLAQLDWSTLCAPYLRPAARRLAWRRLRRMQNRMR